MRYSACSASHAHARRETFADHIIKQEADRIEAEMRSLDALQPATVVDTFDPFMLVIRITRTFARFQKQPFKEQRDILRVVFKEIIVENGAIPSMTLNGAFAIGTKASTPLTSCRDHAMRRISSKRSLAKFSSLHSSEYELHRQSQ